MICLTMYVHTHACIEIHKQLLFITIIITYHCYYLFHMMKIIKLDIQNE